MNKKEQELFVAFFEEIYEAEEAFEEIKIRLSRCLGYNPTLLFDHISGQTDSISISAMRSYLADHVACNERELYEVFERMDWTRNGSISSNDFIRELTPFREAAPPASNSGTVTPQIQAQFLSLITEYIKRFRILEVGRKEVDFIAPYHAFEQIDYARSGLIGLGELQEFFRANDFQISELQLYLLLHGLRRRCYLNVNLEVFCENLDPLEFGQYEAYQRSIEEQEQNQFLKRSRREQETMRRSRIESQKIEHNIAKEERRKRAELERELELEQRINKEIRAHQENKERHIRRAMLEEDKNIRWNVATGNQLLQHQKLENLVASQRNQQLAYARDQENEVNAFLARSTLRNEEDLEASRRARLYERQALLREQLNRESEYRRRQWRESINASRRQHEDELRIEREKAMRIERDQALRQQQLERMRNIRRHVAVQTTESRRVAQLERELERTRMEMREKQSRVDQSHKRYMPETADRSYGYRT